MLPDSGAHHRLPQSQSLSSSHSRDCDDWLLHPLPHVLLVSGAVGEPSGVFAGHLSCQRRQGCVLLDGLQNQVSSW